MEATQYCLMGHHFHLVVEIPQPNLVAGMKWLLQTDISRFNHEFDCRQDKCLSDKKI